ESFAGYERYVSGTGTSHLDWLPGSVRRLAPLVARLLRDGAQPSSFPTRMRRFAHVLAMAPEARYATRFAAFDATRRRRLFTPEFGAALDGAHPEAFLTDAWTNAPADNQLDRMLATDVETYLPADLLVKVDIASMACSLEARSPFLDQRLMEFAASLPP